MIYELSLTFRMIIINIKVLKTSQIIEVVFSSPDLFTSDQYISAL